MKARITAIAAILIILVINLWAEELDPEEIFSAALEKDLTMKTLLLEKETAAINIAIEDHKYGMSFSAGLNDAGTSVEALGKSIPPVINIQPFIELKLPETAGTTIRAELPVTRSSGETTTEAAAGISLEQDLNSLFKIEKQNTVKLISRNLSERAMELRIKSRKAEVERKVLELIKSLLSLEKSMISNLTSLDEKETLLNNMLNAGMIAQGSSSHLSRLMEIRALEGETEEVRADYTVKLSEFEQFTGIKITEAPKLPTIDLPQKEIDAVPDSIRTSELNLELQKAELDDYTSSVPPQLSANAAGSQTFSGNTKPNISGGVGAVFEDFSVSLRGVWNEKDGGSLSAGVSLGLTDKSLKSLNREIYRHNIEVSALNLEMNRLYAADTIRSIVSEISRIETASKNLKINAEFIRKYLDEMEIKHKHGHIRELELTKAQDQEKIIELDAEILNIDRYLLSNTIYSQMEKW